MLTNIVIRACYCIPGTRVFGDTISHSVCVCVCVNCVRKLGWISDNEARLGGVNERLCVRLVWIRIRLYRKATVIGVMADYPQESYTSLADLPVYGNINIEEAQEAYTDLSEDQLNRSTARTSDRAAQPASVSTSDDDQCIYENYSSDNAKNDGRQSREIKTSFSSKSRTPQAGSETCARPPSVEKDSENLHKEKDTGKEECTVIPNLYGPDPIDGPVTGITATEWILPVRKSTLPTSVKEQRYIQWGSVIFAVLLATSVILNIILFYLNFRAPPLTEIERRRRRVDRLQDQWLEGQIVGNTINTALLLNVASVYNGATCNASSMLLTSAHAHDRHWCHYAIDGREGTAYQPNAWAPAPHDKQTPYIELVFDAKYTVAVVEIVGNISAKQSWRLSLTFGDGSVQNFRRQKGNRSAENTQRDVITVEPITTDSLRAAFIETESGDHQLTLLEIRVFAYGDRPQTAAACCPAGFVYSRDLNHCYFFPTVGPTSTMTPDDAYEDCIGKNSSLLSIHSMAEHDFVRSHFTRMAIEAIDADLTGVQKVNFWTGLRRQPLDLTSWRWSNGYAMTYQSWGSGQPNGNPGEPCMELRAHQSFDWNDKVCSSKLMYACDAPSSC